MKAKTNNAEAFFFSIMVHNTFGGNPQASAVAIASNSSRYSTNPPLQFPIWQLTSKETKRQAITKEQKKNEMKAKP